MMNTQNTKSNLAKLLATENINVEYRKTQTASFNVESRTLTLPVWNDMTTEMTDLLIGHEVGHALDTPKEYGTAQEDMGKGFKTFLNVVEDARIERRIKDRYPGLRRSFAKGYQEFINRDFFQVNNRDVNKMLLVDRINLHYKIGPFFPIQFNEVESGFLKKVDACETFDDVIAVSKELYSYCKDELEQKRQEAMEEFKQKLEAGEFDEDDEYDDSYDSFDDYNDQEDNSDWDEVNPDSVEPGDGDADEDFEKGRSTTGAPEYKEPKELQQYDEVKSATDENLENALRSLTENKEIYVGKIPSTAVGKNIVVPFSEILGKIFISEYFVNEDPELRYIPNLLSEFETKNKNAILYLVKEFEMKKKAAELRRVVVSNTGVLDTNKLHTYKFNDDIFRKVGNTPQGKNHGIVMFVDWSGSMADNMSGTIEQLITLTTFCRKVNIAFEVYAFSTEYYKNSIEKPSGDAFNVQHGDLQINDKFYLLNLLSSRMRNQQYRRMANDLLNYGKAYETQGHYFRNYRRNFIDGKFGLGGTPLNSTIVAASEIVNDFRRKSRIEVMDVIFLTDGEDSDNIWTQGVGYYDSKRIGSANRNSVSYIEDKQLCKSYRVGDNGVMPVLLQNLKDRTGCNLIGFYILQKNRRSFNQAAERFRIPIAAQDTGFAQFKNEKFFAIDDYGYDQYFLIPGGEDLSTEDESLDDLLGNNNTEVSTRKLKGAFLKMNKNRLTNRILLSKVVEEIA